MDATAADLARDGNPIPYCVVSGLRAWRFNIPDEEESLYVQGRDLTLHFL